MIIQRSDLPFRYRTVAPVHPDDVREYEKGSWGYRQDAQTCQRCGRSVPPQCAVRLLDMDDRCKNTRVLILCRRCRDEHLGLV
jgi:hypothetical protein